MRGDLLPGKEVHMTEEWQQTRDEDDLQREGDDGPPVTEAGGDYDRDEKKGREGSAGQEPGDPGREA
jgi:hypothetical protein